MSKKIWFLLVVIIVLLASLLLFWFFKSGSVTYWMNGSVVRVSDGLLVVLGIAKSSELGETYQEERTVEFKITPKTIFKRTTTSISRSNKTFSSEIIQGSASDLSKNMKIFKIESNNNLFTDDEAVASYVNYEVIEIRD